MCLRLSLPLGNCFTNEIEIFFVELLLFLALSTTALLLLLPFLVSIFFVFLFVDDESFLNLYVEF